MFRVSLSHAIIHYERIQFKAMVPLPIDRLMEIA